MMSDMEKVAGHTAGPWQQKHDFDREGMLTIIGNVDGEYVDGVPQCTYTAICEVDDNADGLANAAFIVQAVNSHDELVAALEKCANALLFLSNAVFNDNGDMTISAPYPTSGHCVTAYFAHRDARAALSRATKQEG